MRAKCYQLLILLMLAGTASAQTPAKLLVYIQPQEYEHPIKLWQYYKDFWFSQGSYIEQAAKRVLGASFGEVTMCDANQQLGQVLVWLRPRMFYNPQLQVYYGKVIAVAYTYDGKPVDTYIGEANKHGFLDVKPELQLKEVYEQAMQEIAEQMQTDSKLQEAFTKTNDASVAGTPCAMTSLLPLPKVQFMSF